MKFFISTLIFSFFLISCTEKKINYPTESFTDVLNLKNIPDSAKQKGINAFFDKGAWFGFGLAPDNDTAHAGAFVGPFSNFSNFWVSQILLQTSPVFLFQKQEIRSSSSQFLPGKLVHTVNYDSLSVEQELIFISSNTALIKLKTINKSAEALAIKFNHTGELLPEQAEITANDSRISIWLNNDQSIIDMHFSKPKFFSTGTNDIKSYTATDKLFRRIKANDTETEYISISFFTSETEREKEPVIIAENADYSTYFTENSARWNGYLQKVVYSNSVYSENAEYRRLAMKSLLTLVSNWRSAKGNLLHEGIIPSYSVDFFDGFWAWDSWKHAVALSLFEPEVAKNQIRTMFDYVRPDGMVPDCIYTDSTENNYMNSKPPLAAWAVMKVYKATNDKAFLLEMLPKLLKYHSWWYLHRDFNENGLCEFGSSENSLEAARWESGMDNAIRFDSVQMVQSKSGSWSMNSESVDLNAYLYAEKLYLAEMLEIAGKESDAEQFEKEAEDLKELINETFFDKAAGFYFDRIAESKAFIKVYSPEGWTPLFCQVSEKKQAKQVSKILNDSTFFNTHVPFPTVSRNDKNFSTGYWRGTVWIDQVYFAIEGLRNYNYDTEAETFTRKLFDNAQGLTNSDQPIYENYWTLDGKPMRTPNFSWSAAHLLLLYNGE